MKAIVIYYNNNDKELLAKIELTIPFLIEYINMNTSEVRKAGFKELNYWSAKKLPFVYVIDNDKPIKVFYSEIGNAINQFIKWYES